MSSIYSLHNGVLELQVNSKGAEMCSLRKCGGKQLLWDANPEYWARHAPNLFPIVGKLQNQKYHFQGKTYTLSQHGFLRDSETTMIESTEDSLMFELRSSESTREVYPFDFRLHIQYHLKENQLRTRYICINEGQSALYFSVGAHPAFRLSQNTGSLRIRPQEQMDCFQLNEGCIQQKPVFSMDTHEILLTPQLFDRDALIFKETSSTQIMLDIDEDHVCIDTGNMPYLGIWSKPGAPFVCIEPWSGLADIEGHNGDLETKEGIIKVEAGQSCERFFDIRIE